MKTNKNTMKPYKWGDNCKGWKLLNQTTLSVIEEIMPPNTQETLHYHAAAQQYFYILEGTAAFIVNDKMERVKAMEGIYIPNNTVHQIQNQTPETIRFLVISNPTTKGDRVEAVMPPIFNYHHKYFQSVNNTENGEGNLIIKLGKPKKSSKPEGDWECPIQIGETIKLAFGVDSYQALSMALQLISIEVKYLKEKQNINLNWLGLNNLGL